MKQNQSVWMDVAFKNLTRSFAIMVFLLLAAIMASLI